jgi:hypothetical protein
MRECKLCLKIPGLKCALLVLRKCFVYNVQQREQDNICLNSILQVFFCKNVYAQFIQKAQNSSNSHRKHPKWHSNIFRPKWHRLSQSIQNGNE